MAFEGVLTALVTPFDDAGAVDLPALQRLVKRQVDAGISGLVPCGTTGESPTLSAEEHDRVIRGTVEAAGGVPVLAGIGSYDTASAIRTARIAQAAGATGVLATAPYYNKPSQRGLYLHFRAIAEAVPDVEVCVYDVPGRSAVKVDTDTIARLTEIPNVRSVKDATADLANGAELYRATAPGTRILSGDDFTTVALVAVGGAGCVSVASNLIPARMVAMVHAARRGDMAFAREENARLQPLFRALFVQSSPLPIKTALSFLGLCQPTFRLPLCPMDPGPLEILRQALADLEAEA